MKAESRLRRRMRKVRIYLFELFPKNFTAYTERYST